MSVPGLVVISLIRTRSSGSRGEHKAFCPVGSSLSLVCIMSWNRLSWAIRQSPSWGPRLAGGRLPGLGRWGRHRCQERGASQSPQSRARPGQCPSSGREWSRAPVLGPSCPSSPPDLRGVQLTHGTFCLGEGLGTAVWVQGHRIREIVTKGAELLLLKSCLFRAATGDEGAGDPCQLPDHLLWARHTRSAEVRVPRACGAVVPGLHLKFWGRCRGDRCRKLPEAAGSFEAGPEHRFGRLRPRALHFHGRSWEGGQRLFDP